MKILKKVIVWLIILIWLCLVGSGCGSPFMTGAATGAGAGFLGSETIKGMQADLEAKEQELIWLYNQGVEAG